MQVNKKDRLIIRKLSLDFGISLTIRFLIKDANGLITPHQERLETNPLGPVTQDGIYQLTDGELISVIVTPEPGAPRRGQCWVQGVIAKDTFNWAGAVVPLFADYLCWDGYLGWPGGKQRQSVEEAGCPVVIPVANPAVGVDFAYVVPFGVRYRPISVAFTLTTINAVAPNRQARITFTFGGVIFSFPFTATLQGAPLAYNYRFCGAPSFVGFLAPNVDAEMPGNLILRTASIISSAIVNLFATDQISNINLCLEQWMES